MVNQQNWTLGAGTFPQEIVPLNMQRRAILFGCTANVQQVYINLPGLIAGLGWDVGIRQTLRFDYDHDGDIVCQPWCMTFSGPALIWCLEWIDVGDRQHTTQQPISKPEWHLSGTLTIPLAAEVERIVTALRGK